MPNLSEVKVEAPSCGEYIENMSPQYKGGYVRLKSAYTFKTEPLEKLKNLGDEYTFVIIFADWCGDARKAVPVMAKLEEELGIKIPSLGGMTKPPYGSDKFWAVPPSPEEVDKFEITSSPTILVFDSNGEEIGRIKTRPRMTKTFEEELVKIIEDSKG
jgi:thiol-disulfide isomerase/thioredoxin